ncbi:hypothetical protein J1N35_037750 [Gossypium stocksii]|uniref:Uncharacterized protein n=1 Tax=Gossypium stocksii TaxID=47602 RepID=A0A9D3ZL81_9ROSI|nr:hypothetical protein J1N35_037750 [Gossypium stocksii]
MTVEDLIVKLRIEENNRGETKRLNKATNPNFANANIMEVKKDSKKRKHSQIGSKLGSKVNLVDSNTRKWWLNTDATCHICCNKDSFVELVSCEKGEKLYMGNTARLRGKALRF